VLLHHWKRRRKRKGTDLDAGRARALRPAAQMPAQQQRGALLENRAGFNAARLFAAALV
jgi:hypothetical protein